MWKMLAKESIQTRIVTASAVKRVLDFWHRHSVCPATHTEDIQAKRNTHKLLRINHPYYRNVAKRNLWRESQIITFENAFHIWINIGTFVNAHFLQCHVSSNTSMHILQTATYNLNFIVLLLLSSRISQNWSAPNHIRCFINGENNYLFIYFNKCNRLDILIFRL